MSAAKTRGRRLGAFLSAAMATFGALAAAVGVPLYFANSSWVAARLQDLLRIGVDPSFSGGALAAEFPDPIGDDSGPGGYEYPLGQGWERGELDLLRYAARVPVARPLWASSGAYWQLEASFAKAVSNGLGGFRAPVLHIYIGLGGAEARGSAESAFGEGELVRFDPALPWNYVVSADGWSPSGEIRSADGSYRAPVQANWDLKRRRLTLRVGLAKAPPLLQSVLGGRPTRHYVLVGAYDPAREGRFAALRDFASLHDGGGAKDSQSPRVFDLIAPRGRRQAAELSSQNEAAGIFALLSPVEVGGGALAPPDPGLRSALEAVAAKDAAAVEASLAARREALPPPSSDRRERIPELYALGLEGRCLEAARKALVENPSDPLALAYRGAIVAKEADRAILLGEKMRLVDEAYRDLDAAIVEAAARPPPIEESLDILLCRGGVSSAVPNEVFGRAAQGAGDLVAAGELAARAGDRARAAACMAEAALAYEKAGLEEEASARWATLAETGGLSAALRLKLIERGFAADSGL